MAELRLTDTNAADDSRGSVWGLDGNLFLPVVASAALSIGTTLILFAALQAHWLISGMIGAAPFVITLGYVLALKQGKPPAHDVDLLESWVLGPGFELNPHQQPSHRPPTS